MLRVLMTTDTVGGVWNYAAQLTEELLKRGNAVALAIIGREPNLHQQQWLDETTVCWAGHFQHETCAAPLEWMSDNEQAFMDAQDRLLILASAFGATVLHSNQFCFGALEISIPRIVVAHSDVLSWTTACRGEAAEAGPWLDRYTALVTTGLWSADCVIAPTRWMLSALSANFSIPNPSSVISNGRTLMLEGQAPGRSLQAVSAGRFWDEAKNLKLLAAVEFPFPILIAGEAEFVTSTESLPGRSLKLLGPLSQEALMSVFRASKIYICPSLYEPFGLAPLEAALCGCAVLANDTASLREVWAEGALYFSDARGLSELLTRLNNSPQELTAAQQRSLSRALGYSAEAMADRYIALYESMVSAPGMRHVA